MILHEDGYAEGINEDPDVLYECDRCRQWFLYSDHGDEMYDCLHFWQGEIFRQMHKLPWMYGEYCIDCLKIMTPYVYIFKDIKMLDRSVNKLERSIRERRKKHQNHRAA